MIMVSWSYLIAKIVCVLKVMMSHSGDCTSLRDQMFDMA